MGRTGAEKKARRIRARKVIGQVQLSITAGDGATAVTVHRQGDTKEGPGWCGGDSGMVGCSRLTGSLIRPALALQSVPPNNCECLALLALSKHAVYIPEHFVLTLRDSHALSVLLIRNMDEIRRAMVPG